MFIEQFRQTIPNYMLRHNVQGRHHRLGPGQRLARQHLARASASQYDLYYIENWSLLLDLKILCLTLFRGFTNRMPTSGATDGAQHRAFRLGRCST